MAEQQHRTAPSLSAQGFRGPLVMPFANVMHLPFSQMLEATRLAGFGGLSLRPHDVLTLQSQNISPQAAQRMALDFGVEIVRLDPLSAWTAIVSSSDTNLDISPREFFEMCAGLGCKFASLNATFPTDYITRDQVVEDFARTCDIAAEFGVTCDLENLPMWGVKSLSDASDIVQQADRPNGGLVLDILHFVRGGSKVSDLKTIPGDRINTVQLNDGPLTLPSDISLFDNCFDRLWPGDGEFPITEILIALKHTGGLAQVNPEVFSPGNAFLGPAEIAAKSSDSLRAVLLRADLEI